jgi:hypothetical protein
MGFIGANDGRTARHAYTYVGVSVVVGICIMVLILGSYVGFPRLCVSYKKTNDGYRYGLMELTIQYARQEPALYKYISLEVSGAEAEEGFGEWFII